MLVLAIKVLALRWKLAAEQRLILSTQVQFKAALIPLVFLVEVVCRAMVFAWLILVLLPTEFLMVPLPMKRRASSAVKATVAPQLA